jgi:LCP family protein required for cell wall assembly
LALLGLAVIVCSGVAWASYKSFTASIPTGAAVPSLAAGQHDIDGKDQNILLIGDDSRAGASVAELKALKVGNVQGTVNADTVILLHIPSNGRHATLVSFPRDSWVAIPGHGKGKLNSAYPDGYNAARAAGKSETAAQSAGIILTVKTIEALTGLHVDHYVQVNLLGFYRISNAVGGVAVCLNAAQNASTDRDAFGHGYSGIDLPKGVSVIRGKQALAFVRQRHGLPNGDLDRIKRQQYFLASAFHKIETAGVLLNPFKLHRLLKAVGSSLLVDPGLNVLSLSHQLDALTSGHVRFETLPNEGPQTIYPDGVMTSIVGVDTPAIPGFVRSLQGLPADPKLAAAAPANPRTVVADVLNGTTTVRLAAHNADRLRALHFQVNTIDSTALTSATTVEYRPGETAQAKAVAGVVPGAHLVMTSTVARVTLVLGTNGVVVSGLSGAGGAGNASGAGRSASAAGSPAKHVTSKVNDGLGCIN